jgi:hypothetical protein
MVASLERKNDEFARDAETNRATIRDFILEILESQGVTCSNEALEKLHSCTDADVLKKWVKRARTATSEADVFTPRD